MATGDGDRVPVPRTCRRADVSRLRGWMSRLAHTLRRDRFERELAEELDSHIQLHAEDAVRRGLSPEQAQREARLRLVEHLGHARESVGAAYLGPILNKRRSNVADDALAPETHDVA